MEKSREIGSTAALVADLRAALVPDAFEAGPPETFRSARAEEVDLRPSPASGPTGPSRSRRRSGGSEASDANPPLSASSRSSADGGSSRGHLVNAARSVLAAPQPARGGGANSSRSIDPVRGHADPEKSATWPLTPPNQDAWKGFAGRPTTPEAERARRRDRERERTMQRSAGLTIPFHDGGGEKPAPPPGFLKRAEAAQERRERRHVQAGDQESPRHGSNGATMGGATMAGDSRSRTMSGTRSVQTLHAPPSSHAAGSRPAPGGRRTRSGGPQAAPSSGRSGGPR